MINEKDWKLEKFFKKGPQGAVGKRGIKGSMGIQGDVGPKGDKGLPGDLIDEYVSNAKKTFRVYLCSNEDRVSPPEGGTYVFKKGIEKFTEPEGWKLDTSSFDESLKNTFYSIGTFHGSVKDPTPIECKEWSDPIKLNSFDGLDNTVLKSYTRNNIPDFEGLPPISPTDGYGTNNWNGKDYTWSLRPSGVTQRLQFEWVSQKNSGRWQKPTILSQYGKNGKDGDGIHYIFKLGNEQPTRPTGDDVSEQGWLEDPVDPTEELQYLYMSNRSEKIIEIYDDASGNVTYNTKKTDWSIPRIWTLFMPDSIPGIKMNLLGAFSDYDDFVEKVLNKITWEGDNAYVKYPNDSVIYLLKIGDCFIVDGVTYAFNGDKSDPFTNCGKFGDSKSGNFIHIRYAKNMDTLHKANLLERQLCFTKNLGQSDEGAKFYGICINTDKMGGEDVKDPLKFKWRYFSGQDGFGIEYIFTRTSTMGERPYIPVLSKDETNNPISKIDWSGVGIDKNGNETTWTDNSMGVSSNVGCSYEWYCKRTTENGVRGEYKGDKDGMAKLYAYYNLGSTNDPNAKDGVILYPVGLYDPNVKYSRTSNTCPYVKFGFDYYYFWNDGNAGNMLDGYIKTPEDSWDDGDENRDGIWVKIDKFEAIYCEIILAKNANVGSSVFVDNYMFSQFGIDENGNPTKNFENFWKYDPYYETNTYDYYTSDEYVKIEDGDKVHPTGVFKPNWCVDFLNGNMWINAGRVKTNGYGQNFEINDGEGTILFYIDENGEVNILGAVKKKPIYIGNEFTFNNVLIPLPISLYEYNILGQSGYTGGQFLISNGNLGQDMDIFKDGKVEFEYLGKTYTTISGLQTYLDDDEIVDFNGGECIIFNENVNINSNMNVKAISPIIGNSWTNGEDHSGHIASYNQLINQNGKNGGTGNKDYEKTKNFACAYIDPLYSNSTIYIDNLFKFNTKIDGKNPITDDFYDVYKIYLPYFFVYDYLIGDDEDEEIEPNNIDVCRVATKIGGELHYITDFEMYELIGKRMMLVNNTTDKIISIANTPLNNLSAVLTTKYLKQLGSSDIQNIVQNYVSVGQTVLLKDDETGNYFYTRSRKKYPDKTNYSVPLKTVNQETNGMVNILKKYDGFNSLNKDIKTNNGVYYINSLQHNLVDGDYIMIGDMLYCWIQRLNKWEYCENMCESVMNGLTYPYLLPGESVVLEFVNDNGKHIIQDDDGEEEVVHYSTGLYFKMVAKANAGEEDIFST